ncbi:hypothetical protein GCM10009789_38880 [Kribbella sancticallisti]|uniref:Uncharacterized protein n=1 Tax=Kribbella sancticallisti TaxID=460087 RepID=A0ABP4PNA0_9ACTN
MPPVLVRGDLLLNAHSWMARSRFSGTAERAIFGTMTSEVPGSGQDNAEGEQAQPDGGHVWSVRKLIELIDEAIDTAGAQLARSGGLWADSASPIADVHRPPVRRSPASGARPEEPDTDYGVSLL